MQTSDILWLRLIFTHCMPRALLPLRATCRDFRAMLASAEAHPLWRRLTMTMDWLRHDERTMGGLEGVKAARDREECIRSNAAAGRFERGPVFRISESMRKLVYASGRIAVFDQDTITLYDLNTGALVSTYAVSVTCTNVEVVLDRWIPFGTPERSLVLLDCVTGAVSAELSPPDVERLFAEFSVCESVISHFQYGRRIVTCSHIDASTGAVHNVHTRELRNRFNRMVLCNQGESYIEYSEEKSVAWLVDVRTGLMGRQYMLPSHIQNVTFEDVRMASRDIFVISVHSQQEGNGGFAAFRVSDGQCLAFRRGTNIILCNPNATRICNYDHTERYGKSVILNPWTGHELATIDSVGGTIIDTSGLVLMQLKHTPVLSVCVAPTWKTARDVPMRVPTAYTVHLNFGICTFVSGDDEEECHVLRFDLKADLNADLKADAFKKIKPT